MKNNKFTRFAFLGVASLLLTSCFGNKGGGGNSGYNFIYNIDGPNKVKIQTANFGGGIGNLWLEKAADRFAHEMENYTFPSGKKGVYIDTSFTSFELGTSSAETMLRSTRSIFFDERMSDPADLSQGGALLDLNEIVMDASREGGSLDSVLFDSIKNGLKHEITTDSGVEEHYFALPHYEYYGGLSYNREIFDTYGAYFIDEDLSAGPGFVYTGKTIDGIGGSFLGPDYTIEDGYVLSSGPNGVAGDNDDGLPRTLDEFIVLMDYLKFRGVQPIALSGQYNRYLDYLVAGLWSSLAGAEKMKNYYNCTGELEVVKLDNSGKVKLTQDKLFTGIDILKPETEIVTMASDGSQGYYGNLMVEKYEAMALCEVINKYGFFTDNSSVGTNSHYDAQGDLFLYGAGDDSYNPGAMLVEGSYWYNETEEMAGQLSYFERLSGRNRNDLDLRWMNLPTSVNNTDFGDGKEQCLLDIGHTYAYVNANVANNPDLKEACLKFMSFLYSKEELANFTVETGMSRMLDYEVSDLSQFEPFYKRLYEQRQANTDNVVGLSGNTQAFQKNKPSLKIELQSKCMRNHPDSTKAKTLYALLNSGSKVADLFADYYHDLQTAWIS